MPTADSACDNAVVTATGSTAKKAGSPTATTAAVPMEEPIITTAASSEAIITSATAIARALSAVARMVVALAAGGIYRLLARIYPRQ